MECFNTNYNDISLVSARYLNAAGFICPKPDTIVSRMSDKSHRIKGTIVLKSSLAVMPGLGGRRSNFSGVSGEEVLEINENSRCY